MAKKSIKIKDLLDLLASPKKTRVIIFKEELLHAKVLWNGYTYYPNPQLELYLKMKVHSFTVLSGDIYIYAKD